jgi:DNA replication protein DnaC
MYEAPITTAEEETMLHQQTIEKLQEMKLHGFVLGLEEQSKDTEVQSLSFEERLGLLVEREWLLRLDRRLERRLKMARLRFHACMENIDYRTPRGLDRSVMRTLAGCNWIREKQCVLIVGPTGVGKSYIACALANKACREGFTSLYTRIPRLMHEMSIARGDGSYLKLLAKLSRIDVLVLDDWGLSPFGDLERRDILEILEDRSEERSTIVASQLPTEKWYECIGEPTLADAILDRLINGAHKIKLKGPTMRAKKEKKK